MIELLTVWLGLAHADVIDAIKDANAIVKKTGAARECTTCAATQAGADLPKINQCIAQICTSDGFSRPRVTARVYEKVARGLPEYRATFAIYYKIVLVNGSSNI